MALVSCQECGHGASKSAKSCPQCGATGRALTGRKPFGCWKPLLFGFLGVCVISGIMSTVNPPEPLTVEEKAKKELEDKRNVNVGLYLASLKARLRDPTSFSLENASTNDDGTIVCFSYRARNGFDGYSRERVAFAPNGGSSLPSIVRTLCRDKDMRDYTMIAQSILDTL